MGHEVLMKIGAHYLADGCQGCPWHEVVETCDGVPLNCKWIVLAIYFGQEDENGE